MKSQKIVRSLFVFSLVFINFFLIQSCSRKEKSSQADVSPTAAPKFPLQIVRNNAPRPKPPKSKYYRYKDILQPFTVVMPAAFGSKVGIETAVFLGGFQYDINNFKEPGYQISIYPDSQESLNYIKENALAARISGCFTGKKEFSRNILIKAYLEENGAFVEHKLPAVAYRVDEAHIVNAMEGWDPDYDVKVIEWIIFKIPEDLNASFLADSVIVVKLKFPFLQEEDQDSEGIYKTARMQREKLCQAARSFTWVQFEKPSIPPPWERFKMGMDYPEPEVVIR